jgi:HlyD family secretion protein
MEKKSRKKLFIFLGVVVVLLIFIIASLGKSGGSKIKVQTDKVTRGEITASVSGSAKIQPEIQVKISAKVSGQIIRLGVEEGDFVKKGQFLVELDQEYYRAALKQAKSNYDYAVAGLMKAENEYERTKKLYAGNLASEADLDLAKSTYQQASAMVKQAEASKEQSEDDLSKTTIYSPMDGTVSQLNKKVGEMAMGSQFTLDVIMIVADLTKMLAETEIDENDVISVSLGDTSDVEIDAFPDTTFKGIVKEIANTGTSKGLGTQEEVTNFLVKISMLTKPEALRPSMSATVDILTETHKGALMVPIQCITMRKPVKPESEKKPESGKKPKSSDKASSDSTKAEPEKATPDEEKEAEPIRVVFIVKDGIAHQAAVETGLSSDTHWEIKKGLEEGDEVVSGSYRILSKQLKNKNQVTVDNSAKKYGSDEEE